MELKGGGIVPATTSWNAVDIKIEGTCPTGFMQFVNGTGGDIIGHIDLIKESKVNFLTAKQIKQVTETAKAKGVSDSIQSLEGAIYSTAKEGDRSYSEELRPHKTEMVSKYFLDLGFKTLIEEIKDTNRDGAEIMTNRITVSW